MKPLYYFSFLLAVIFFNSCNSGDSPSATNSEGERIMKATKAVLNRQISFSKALDRSKLEKLVADEQKNGIVLEYDSLRFDTSGQLEYIAYSVDIGKGEKRSASARLDTLTMVFGFQYVKENDSLQQFEIGSLKAL